MVKKNDDATSRLLRRRKIEEDKIIRQKRTKLMRIFLPILGLVIIGYLYLATDISKPKSITVSGNNILSKEEVLKYADVDYKHYMLIKNPIVISYNLNKHPLIAKVSVNWSLIDRRININVVEKEVFGYRQNEEGAYIIMADGSHLDLDKQYYQTMPYLIFVSGFEGEELEARLLDSFKNLKPDVRNQISELHQVAVSYDDKLIQLRMNDGNKVFLSLQSVERMNYYFEILENLKVTNSCIYIDEMSGDAFSQACPD